MGSSEEHIRLVTSMQVSEMDSGEKRLNELGYKQELRREMTLLKTLAITFSCMSVFSGTPLYGQSLRYAGPACLVWGWVISGLIVIIMLPLIAQQTKSASYVFTHFETSPESTGISSIPYAAILSLLLSHYSLYGYDAAAHLTEETKGADRAGPIAILSNIGIITVFGWAYNLALTFSIRDLDYLYNPNNETAGALVPAQIIYDAFQGRFNNSCGAIIFLSIIWVSFLFCGLSVTTAAARVVYALSRDKGIPFSPVWRKVDPQNKVPKNAVWFCATICMFLGLPMLKLDVVFTAIISISTVGWFGGYAVPILARFIMKEEKFKPGPFYLGKARRPICLVAFLWVCYTCSVFFLPTVYPLRLKTFNYAPIALGVCLTLIILWWFLDARKWFKGPVRNIDIPSDGNLSH
nr:amino-acid permease BAT1 homolog [Ziziphus jujuba var. spinosa]